MFALTVSKTVILAPVSRLPAPGKDRPRAFDYHDVNVGVLMAAARARQRVYGPQGE